MAFRFKNTFRSLSPLVAADAEFGRSVSMHKRNIAIGSPQDMGGNGSISFFYLNDDNEWELSNKFNIATPIAYPYKLSMWNNLIAASQPFFSSGGLIEHGLMAIFWKNGSTWNPVSTIAGTVSNENLGYDVSLYNNECIVGIRGTNGGEGSARLYSVSDTGTLTLSHTFVSPSPENNSFFGSAVGIYGDYAVIGAPRANNDNGVVYIFHRNQGGANNWGLYSILNAFDSTPGDRFGAAIDIYDDLICVSAPEKTYRNQQFVGASYVYRFQNSQWRHIKKLVPTGGTGNYESYFFGTDVKINDKFITVGSPGHNSNNGAIYTYRIDSGDELYQLIAPDNTGQLGYSVDLYDDYILGGGYGENDNDGEAYLYQQTVPKLRLSQYFSLEGDYIPSKASVYLKRGGRNTGNSFVIDPNSFNVIDASNFKDINQGNNKILFDEQIEGFTGNGYMVLAPGDFVDIIGDSFDTINYPITSNRDHTYTLWMRVSSSEVTDISALLSDFEADILIDGYTVTTITESITYGEWSWISTNIVFPDTREHIVGIKLKEKGNAIDKIYFDGMNESPYLEGPSYSPSPFFTVHMRLHRGYDKNVPVHSLYTYDYKNSIEEMFQNDWYNFNISILDDRVGYDANYYFKGNFFLVMSTSGDTANNYCIWEIRDNDEYRINHSLIKV